MEQRQGSSSATLSPPTDRPARAGACRCVTLDRQHGGLCTCWITTQARDGRPGQAQGYIERQVTGWVRRYQEARTAEVPDIERTMAWLAENRPAESASATLIHNDFSSTTSCSTPTG